MLLCCSFLATYSFSFNRTRDNNNNDLKRQNKLILFIIYFYKKCFSVTFVFNMNEHEADITFIPNIQAFTIINLESYEVPTLPTKCDKIGW